MARWAAVLALAAATAIAVASVAGGDMSADKTECADQLVGLAPCLQYVQGQARAPPPDCCGGLRQVLGKSPKCLCVLVKDKDDPNLGIKINATLALALPNACGATRANVSHCARTSSLSSSFSRPASASEATRPPPGPGVAFLLLHSLFPKPNHVCVILFYFIFGAELLHIPPGSKDAAVFSPGSDKGSTAAPGQPASLPPLPPRCSSFI